VNKDKGGVAMKACQNACIGCGKCAKVCKFDAITVENNLAYIDPEKCKACGMCVPECPNKAIHCTFTPPTPKPKEAAPAAPKAEAPAAPKAAAAPKAEAPKAPEAPKSAE
jgi:ferredoxin